ncbi:hypothetical protein LINPERHAP2_LOCUS33614 [Linum perenne]
MKGDRSEAQRPDLRPILLLELGFLVGGLGEWIVVLAPSSSSVPSPVHSHRLSLYGRRLSFIFLSLYCRRSHSVHGVASGVGQVMMRGGVEIRRRRRCLADDGRRGSGGRHSIVGLCVDVTLFPIPHSNSNNRICLSSVALNLSNKPDGRIRDSVISVEASKGFAGSSFRLVVTSKGRRHFIFIDLEQLVWIKSTLEVAAGADWKLPLGCRFHGSRRSIALQSFRKSGLGYLNIAERCKIGLSFFVNIPAEPCSVGWPSFLRLLSEIAVEMLPLPPRSVAGAKSYADVVSGTSFPLDGNCLVGEENVICVQKEGVDERVQFLSRCLFFRFSSPVPEALGLDNFRSWALRNWGVPKEAKLTIMGDDLWMLECRSSDEVERIRSLRRVLYGSSKIFLDKWTEMAGCTEVLQSQRLEWVVASGIPLHLRSVDLFKRLGYLCGGYVDHDSSCCSFNAIRVKVKSSATIPRSISVSYHGRSFPVSIYRESAESLAGVPRRSVIPKDKGVVDAPEPKKGSKLSALKEWRIKRWEKGESSSAVVIQKEAGRPNLCSPVSVNDVVDSGFAFDRNVDRREELSGSEAGMGSFSSAVTGLSKNAVSGEPAVGDVPKTLCPIPRGSNPSFQGQRMWDTMFHSGRGLDALSTPDTDVPTCLHVKAPFRFRGRRGTLGNFVGLSLSFEDGLFVITRPISPWQDLSLFCLLDPINSFSLHSIQEASMCLSEAHCRVGDVRARLGSALLKKVNLFSSGGEWVSALSSFASGECGNRESLVPSADGALVEEIEEGDSSISSEEGVVGEDVKIVEAVNRVAGAIDLQLFSSSEKALASVQARRLERPFEESEVWKVIVESDGEKAPGPDGFHLAFFKRFWSFIKVAESVCGNLATRF